MKKHRTKKNALPWQEERVVDSEVDDPYATSLPGTWRTGSQRLITGNGKSFPARHGHVAQTALFRKHGVFAAGSRVSALRSFYPGGAWRENTRNPGSNDVAAQMNAAGDEYYH
jgi:hypothetical protein